MYPTHSDLSLKIVIVEDEIIISESIYRSLLSLNYSVVEPVASYSAAFEVIGAERPDLILLDIRLAGSKDGIDLANEINALYGIPFIFLTSDSDPITIGRAKNTHPAAYLLKPFTKADLYSTIEIAYQNYLSQKEAKDDSLAKKQDHLLIKHNKKFIKVPFSEILFIRSQHVYVEVTTVSNKKFLVRTSLSKYLELLPPYIMRIHRSHAVNISNIDEISSQMVVLKGYSLPVSKEYKKEFENALRHS